MAAGVRRGARRLHHRVVRGHCLLDLDPVRTGDALLVPGTGRGRLGRRVPSLDRRDRGAPNPRSSRSTTPHLLDDASAVLVHHLAIDRLAGVVLTVRSGEPRPDPVTALWKDGDAEYVQLEALRASELHDFVTAVLDGPVDEETVDRLWAVTRGNLLVPPRGPRRGHGCPSCSYASAASGGCRVRSARPSRRRPGPRPARRARRRRPRGVDTGRVRRADPVRRSSGGSSMRRCSPGWGNGAWWYPKDATQASPVRLAHPLYGEVLRAELSPLEEVDACRRLAEAALAAGVAGGSHLRWVVGVGAGSGRGAASSISSAERPRAALDAADRRAPSSSRRRRWRSRRTFEMARTLGEALFASAAVRRRRRGAARGDRVGREPAPAGERGDGPRPGVAGRPGGVRRRRACAG